MKHQYSWTDSINIVKTFITSRFIFLVRMLPIPFPKYDMARWQRLLSNFIWSQKQNRIAHKIIRILYHKDSLGIPDVKLYYEAANLMTVLRLLNSTAETHWMKIEAMNTKGYTVQDIFWLPKTITDYYA